MKKASQKSKPLKDTPVAPSPPTKTWAQRSRYFDLIGIVTIVLLGAIIYSNSFDCSFHFDDTFNIQDNLNIRDLSNVNAWWSGNRRMAFLTFALDYHFHKFDIWYWHLTNLAIHLITAIVVYWLTLLIFSTPNLKEKPIASHKKEIALFTALLFVAHPLATQSVTYIVQRMASMVAMFYLLSIALYIKARLQQKKRALKYLLFAAAFMSGISAFYTKENAYTLPFAIALVEIYFLQEKRFSFNIKDRRIMVFLAIFAGFAILMFSKFSLTIFKDIPAAEDRPYTLTPLNYLYTQFSVIVKYIQLLFFPVNQVLDYEYPISKSFFEARALLSFLFLASLIGLAIAQARRNIILSFAIFWFFLTLAIESSIIPILDVIYEHRTYLPSFGFFLLISTSLQQFFSNKSQKLKLAVYLLIIGALSVLTYQRNKVWKDDLSLWTDNVIKAPKKARANNNLAVTYYKLRDFDQLLKYSNKAVELGYKYFDGYYIRAVAFNELEQYEKAKADISVAIEINPNSDLAHVVLGNVNSKLGQYKDAINSYNNAIALKPNSFSAYGGLGETYFKLGDYENAIKNFEKELELNPDLATAHNNLGNCYKRTRQKDKAIEAYSKALEIDPDYLNACTNRGLLYFELGNWDKAIADYSNAIRIDPKSAVSYLNRGLVYTKLEDWEKAIADFSSAISINPKYIDAFYSRGLAANKIGDRNMTCQDLNTAAGMGNAAAASAMNLYCK